MMFTKRFMRGQYVSEATFHDEMEQLVREDPRAGGASYQAGRRRWWLR